MNYAHYIRELGRGREGARDLSLDEARTALTAVGSDVPNGFSVTVAIGDKTWVVDSSNVPLVVLR